MAYWPEDEGRAATQFASAILAPRDQLLGEVGTDRSEVREAGSEC
jgi:hypothetical protein